MTLIQQVKDHPFPFKFILSRILLKTGFCKFLTVERSGYKIRFNPSGISAQLWVEPSRMRWEEEFLEDYLKKDDIFIDVGANIGTLSLCASKLVGENGQIFSFEANPDLADFMEDNIKLNKFNNITVFNYAAGEQEGNISFQLNKSDDRSRVSENGENTIKIKMCKLDDVIPVESTISLLKIDTEGYERFVFQGASSIIKRSKVIMFESIESNTSNYDYSTIENILFLKKQNFDIFKLGRNKMMYPFKEKDYLTYEGDLFAISNIDDFISRTNYSIN